MFTKQWIHVKWARAWDCCVSKFIQLLDYLTNDRRNVWKRMHFWQKEFIVLSGLCVCMCVMPVTHESFSIFNNTKCNYHITHTQRSLRNDIWLRNVLKRRLSLPNCHTSNVCSSSSSYCSALFCHPLFFLLPLAVVVVRNIFSFQCSVFPSFYVMSHFES